MAAYQWVPRMRDYTSEKEQEACVRETTDYHPLKPMTVTVTESKAKKTGGKAETEFVDPLSSSLDGTDPLSMFAAEHVVTDPLSMAPKRDRAESGSKAKPGKKSSLDESFEPWSTKKANILSKYTTSERLSITTSFLSPSDREKVAVKTQVQTTMTDKVKNRLEQLDDFEEGSVKEMLNLSQQDYVNRIEELNQALISAWEQDQRVKALKIAIQCSKLLVDISVIQFYPSKFVLITDILDTFGHLVYERIRQKSAYFPPGSKVPQMLPEDFTPDQVPGSAKETCRNWFYKIASIRELIPRLYVETAILRCYSFLTSGEYSQALLRLSNMMRGIGDPLVAVYARTYLCRVGILVAPEVHDHVTINLYDFLTTYKQLQSDSVQNILAVQQMEMAQYLHLYTPALDWILQCVAHRASEDTMTEVLEHCKKQCNSALLLNSVMSAFKPDYIASRALKFVDIIRDCEEAGFPKHELYASLGANMVLADPPEEQRLQTLNEVWKIVMKLKNPANYISCAEVWIEYPCKHFTKREVNTILGDIIKHMVPDRAFEDFYPQLQSIVTKVLSHMHDFAVLFSMDKFLPFIDMFQKESVKVEVCKTVMETFTSGARPGALYTVGYKKRVQQDTTSDPVIMNALMFICKTMHDSVNALTLEDEKKAISNLICGFIRRISFGRDFEQQLSFYVEARATFSNLEPVLIELVQRVNQLSMETHKVVKGNHSRKTAAFVRACAAYSFITIPSINNIFSQLNLYLVSGQVALVNGALTQGDAFMKAAIGLLPEVPRTILVDGKVRSTEPLLAEYINNFVSNLLVVPDNPDQGVLYLIRGLLNVLQNYTWEDNSDAKVRSYLSVTCVLSAMSQESYLYHVNKVDSNDRLYGGDPKFLNEVQQIANTLITEVLEHLKHLQQQEALRRQSALALEFFTKMVVHGDVGSGKMGSLAVNLWNLAQKHGYGDTKVMVRTLEHLKKKGAQTNGKEYAELAAKLPLQSRT
ncbi:VPS35 endosomal protein-sorting factor-like isoform X2 [Branchiostoma lanceolatum]|uniref:VPS35 endosomal protein-sorting factor-like isoform X2 n=1 Tax=Branchiostoma lanceolatum TaxID=7740 RepID=UPI003455BFA3